MQSNNTDDEANLMVSGKFQLNLLSDFTNFFLYIYKAELDPIVPKFTIMVKYSFLINSRGSISNTRQGTSRVGVGGRSLLPFYENKKKSVLIFEKCALFLSIYWLNCRVKCSFKSILEKEHQNFFLRGLPFVYGTWNFYRTKCPYSKKPPLPRRIASCAPE